MCCAWPDSCCLSEAAGFAGGVKSSRQVTRRPENETKAGCCVRRKRSTFPHLSFLPPSLDQEGSVFFYLFVHLSLFAKSESSELLQEANGNVVDLLLEEHGQGVWLPTALGRTVSNEKRAVLQEKKKRKIEIYKHF